MSNEELYKTICIITDDEGTKSECNVVGRFDVNGIAYAILLPVDEYDPEFYRLTGSGKDIVLEHLSQEDEYFDVFDSFTNNMEELGGCFEDLQLAEEVKIQLPSN